jgi:exodeoxyribonuclease-5
LIWSPQQEAALEAVGKWMRKDGPRPCFKLAGYAGTGKTTLARHLAEGAGGKVYFASYTGKAAHVLMRRGVQCASTIHRLIYTPRDKCDARLVELRRDLERARSTVPVDEVVVRKIEVEVAREKQNLRRPEFTVNYDSEIQGAALVVVDEYSMVSRLVGTDLASFGVPVLALGDPGQLPPVHGDCYFAGEPDCLLTEIHRQAEENPVLAMSKTVREGGQLHPGQYGESRVVYRSKLSDGELDRLLLDADQILVGTNATRRQVNRKVRKLLGREGSLPVKGDRLVCLRNSHDEGLLNGQIWEVTSATSQGRMLRLRLRNDDGDRVACLAHQAHFLGEADDLDPWTLRQSNEFDFGYALTVHKAQGSEWDKVLLFDEWHFNDRVRWLYTAVTRAAESITIVR